MSSSLNTDCLLLVLLPISTIIKSCYLPFVLSCPLCNNFLSLPFFYPRAGHLSSSSLGQTHSELFSSLCSAESSGVFAGLFLSSHPQPWAGQMCGWAGNPAVPQGMAGSGIPRTRWREMLMGKHRFPKRAKRVTYLPVKWRGKRLVFVRLRYLVLNLIKCR